MQPASLILVGEAVVAWSAVFRYRRSRHRRQRHRTKTWLARLLVYLERR